MTTKDEPILTFSDAAAWDAWLAKHHDRSGAVLLRIPKGKGSELTYARALDVALAWGWIDSQKRSLDAESWLQRFSPRTAKSPWSKINRTRAEALIASGAMKAVGARRGGESARRRPLGTRLRRRHARRLGSSVTWRSSPRRSLFTSGFGAPTSRHIHPPKWMRRAAPEASAMNSLSSTFPISSLPDSGWHPGS